MGLLFNSLRDRRPRRDKLSYIYDFSRYEKSSSMKRPTLKVIDFDSVVQNTKSSKSIILMSAFSNILLQSRSSEATNIGQLISSRAVFGQILFELNSSCGDLGKRVEVFCLLSEYRRQIFFYLTITYRQVKSYPLFPVILE